MCTGRSQSGTPDAKPILACVPGAPRSAVAASCQTLVPDLQVPARASANQASLIIATPRLEREGSEFFTAAERNIRGLTLSPQHDPASLIASKSLICVSDPLHHEIDTMGVAKRTRKFATARDFHLAPMGHQYPQC